MARILVVKLGALGDVVMATALIDAIVRHHRDDELHLLTTPPYIDLLSGWPAVAVHTRPRRGWRANIGLVRFARAGRYHRIYDLQGNDRTALLCALSGAPERVGNHARFPYTHHPATPWRGEGHIFARMTAVLAAAGVGGVPARPVLPATAAALARVGEFKREHTLVDGRYVLLHAGASPLRRDKVWPHFGALAARLAARGKTVVWIGGESDRADNVALARTTGIDATACFDLRTLAELGRGAAFAVTNDSGPMHVLAASDIAVFGLFGPSDWRRNHALGQATRVIATAALDIPLAHLEVETVWARLAAEGLV